MSNCLRRTKRSFLLAKRLSFFFFVLFFGTTFSEGLANKVAALNQPTRRSVTVADTIRMTQFGDEGYINGLSAKYEVAQFSPDGKRFAVILKNGNLENNTTDYSLVLFPTEKALQSPDPQSLVRLSSSSNRPAIRDLTWVDNHTVAFLGENLGEQQQLYTVDCDTKHLRKLTNHSSSLVSYAMTDGGDRIFFTAQRAPEGLFTERNRREGFVVQGQVLSDLIAGENRLPLQRSPQLFLLQKKAHHAIPVKTGDIVSPRLWLAPDGQHVIVKVFASDIPESWNRYEDELLLQQIRAKGTKDVSRRVYQYQLIDTRSLQSQVLLNAPIGYFHSEVPWSPDSRSVVLSRPYLPLDVHDPAERKARESTRFVAEVTIPNREIAPITDEDLKLRKWDPRTNRLLFQTTTYSTIDLEGKVVAYKKTEKGWKRIEASPSELSGNNQIQVTLEEDMNTPPRILAKNLKTGQKSLLMDLNPQFEQLHFGRVEEVTFKATDGHAVRAGLYRPPDYVPGSRYPLVIQTHAWNPERFWIDGPYSTAFAAQPLAGRGFMVIQLEEDLTSISTPKEAPEETAAYQGAIDYLSGLGLIDSNRVGVIGFSRTCLSVKYALTHYKYPLAAAVVADGVDGGYFQYLAFSNANPSLASEFERINGGLPFGKGLDSWVKLSPSFSLEGVRSPLRVEAHGPLSLLQEWEWFAGLLRLGKPIELIYLPYADHVLVNPWERMTSQQGSVDWFCFWLKGEEDPDPAKADQYTRWRELRKLQEKNEATRPRSKQ